MFFILLCIAIGIVYMLVGWFIYALLLEVKEVRESLVNAILIVLLYPIMIVCVLITSGIVNILK